MPAGTGPILTIVGAMHRIVQGVFGTPTPANYQSSPLAVQQLGPRRATLNSWRPGDLFTPGAQNWVYNPPFELPVQTMWGRAFLRKPNTFSVVSGPQVLSWPMVTMAGLGGVVPGQIITQPLSLPGTNEES
jgi:hypothetical protein